MVLLTDRLKYLYTSQKLNQKQFADLIGIGQSTFNNYLNGIAEPNFKQLTILLRALPNLNATWLMTGDGEPFIENEIQESDLNENTNRKYDFAREDGTEYKRNEKSLLDTDEVMKKQIELLLVEMKRMNIKMELMEKEIDRLKKGK